MGIWKEAAGGADTTGLVRDQRHGVVGVNMAKMAQAEAALR